ncbi:MAG: PEP-CTERM sorting domain-containing protein [Phenylobacterium sp.]
MKLKALILAGAMALVSGTAAVAGPAWEFDTPGNDFSNGIWNFGQAFTVTQDVQASGLGYYAGPNDGQVNDNPVALYQCDNSNCLGGGATLLASVVVDNTYALLGHFRYVTIAPLTLKTGVGYAVQGVSSGNNYTWNNPGFATDPLVTRLGGTRWKAQGTPDFLNFEKNDQSDGYWGPNVFLGDAGGFTGAIPEPSTWAMMLMGFFGLGSMLRSARQRTVAG